jgi:hypothetical protein
MQQATDCVLTVKMLVIRAHMLLATYKCAIIY